MNGSEVVQVYIGKKNSKVKRALKELKGFEKISVLQGESKKIEIKIKDDGLGIAEEYQDKIFDPFFTTKNTGTGLGLATTFSIIKRHGGHISVTATSG